MREIINRCRWDVTMIEEYFLLLKLNTIFFKLTLNRHLFIISLFKYIVKRGRRSYICDAPYSLSIFLTMIGVIRSVYMIFCLSRFSVIEKEILHVMLNNVNFNYCNLAPFSTLCSCQNTLSNWLVFVRKFNKSCNITNILLMVELNFVRNSGFSVNNLFSSYIFFSQYEH